MTDNKQDKNAQNNIEKDVVVAETAEQNNTENDVVETAATENNNIENAAGQNDEIQATAGDSVSEENADSQEEEQVKEPKKSTAEAILEDRDKIVGEAAIGIDANELPDSSKRLIRKNKVKVDNSPTPSAYEEHHLFIEKSERGDADWGVYRRNYGWPYKILFIVAIIGTSYFIFTQILEHVFGIEWTYGWGPIKWFVNVLCTGCLIGVPAMLILPYFSYRKFKRNHIEYEPEYFTYYEYFVDGNTPEGHVEVHNEYKVVRVRVIEETIGYFRVRGRVERTVVTNGKPGKVSVLKKTIIPKSFSNMELIEKYLLGGKNEYHYVKFQDFDEGEGVRRYSSHYKKYKKY